MTIEWKQPEPKFQKGDIVYHIQGGIYYHDATEGVFEKQIKPSNKTPFTIVAFYFDSSYGDDRHKHGDYRYKLAENESYSVVEHVLHLIKKSDGKSHCSLCTASCKRKSDEPCEMFEENK